MAEDVDERFLGRARSACGICVPEAFFGSHQAIYMIILQIVAAI